MLNYVYKPTALNRFFQLLVIANTLKFGHILDASKDELDYNNCFRNKWFDMMFYRYLHLTEMKRLIATSSTYRVFISLEFLDTFPSIVLILSQ